MNLKKPGSEEKKLTLEQVDNTHKIPFELLELADPSRNQIEEYVKTGQCYIAKLNSKLVGSIVLKELTSTTIEIKNIVVSESFQNQGYGKQLLRHIHEIASRSMYEKIVIGTGNSSIKQLALYQKEGFEICSIEKDFFINNYDEPIFENGIQCKHMIILEKKV
ncbi:GNAT family N-acetyltransferase [Aquimarina sp. AU58]|uniref:GNAT family N-acetyltransferase n=1 Tax=Aquimarina sp. AU58 TaxID=1874112 RepID=UPI000D6498F1|nr:N-acetyltransferase [Aquimarina sp. AU58]